MTRLIRPIVVAGALLISASPVLAQKKQLTRRPAGSGSVYGPVYGDTRANRGEDDRYESRGQRHDDDRDHDRDEDHDGPGKNGRGHAYGHYKNKDRKGVKCYDRNYDSICDDAQNGRSSSYPSRYPNTGGYPTTGYPSTGYPSRYPTSASGQMSLPDMIGAIAAAKGQRSAEVSRWIGTQPLNLQTTRAAGGRLSQASWFSPSGQLVQRWIDRDLDGRADAVQLFENGRLVRTMTR